MEGFFWASTINHAASSNRSIFNTDLSYSRYARLSYSDVCDGTTWVMCIKKNNYYFQIDNNT